MRIISIKKGIILAGGTGSRLYPITVATNKHLLPVYDKPMIYYPLSSLMLLDIKEILIISNHSDLSSFHHLLGDGSHLGLSIQYAPQDKPNGIAEAFIIAKDFIGDDSISLILGDNIFHIPDQISNLYDRSSSATILGYAVRDPERYGVIEYTSAGHVARITEKPNNPKSNLAVPGFYFYNNNVVKYAHELEMSYRGEYEITDINNRYLSEEDLCVTQLSRGTAWFDAGTFDSLIDASAYVAAIEHRQGLKISCPEEIAYSKNFIDSSQLSLLAKKYPNSYGQYLYKLIK